MKNLTILLPSNSSSVTSADSGPLETRSSRIDEDTEACLRDQRLFLRITELLSPTVDTDECPTRWKLSRINSRTNSVRKDHLMFPRYEWAECLCGTTVFPLARLNPFWSWRGRTERYRGCFLPDDICWISLIVNATRDGWRGKWTLWFSKWTALFLYRVSQVVYLVRCCMRCGHSLFNHVHCMHTNASLIGLILCWGRLCVTNFGYYHWQIFVVRSELNETGVQCIQIQHNSAVYAWCRKMLLDVRTKTH